MKRIVALFMLSIMVLFAFGCGNDEYNDSKILPNEMPEDFSFTISWVCLAVAHTIAKQVSL